MQRQFCICNEISNARSKRVRISCSLSQPILEQFQWDLIQQMQRATLNSLILPNNDRISYPQYHHALSHPLLFHFGPLPYSQPHGRRIGLNTPSTMANRKYLIRHYLSKFPYNFNASCFPSSQISLETIETGRMERYPPMNGNDGKDRNNLIFILYIFGMEFVFWCFIIL